MKFRFPRSGDQLAAMNMGRSNDVDIDGSVKSQGISDAQDHTSTELPSKEAAVTSNAHADDSASETIVNKEFQRGTQSAQAMTAVWTKRDLILGYIFIWIILFMLAFSSGCVNTLTPYVTSNFQMHSLTATTSIVSSLVAGLFKLPYAKIMDIWGRPQGLCLMAFSMTIGLILMAVCKNVETYCAAQVFYYLGYNGVDFTMTIFIADTSSLKNRSLMLGFAGSPYLITTWCYGPAVTSILNTIGFRWGFGIWAIIIPVICSPLVILMWVNQKKAEKAGLIPDRPSRGNAMQTFKYYLREFDVVGLLLLAGGLSLFLLSFSLYSYQKNTWSSPLIICFLVFGFALLVAFVLYEKYLAPVTFVPWELLTDRTIIFTYIMAASIYVGWYIWDSYFYSLNIVLFHQSITHATYIGNIYTMGSCSWAIVIGLAVRQYGKLKHYALFFGAPMTILGVGIMIRFRQPDVNIGFIVMAQIFVAVGGGTLVICEQMTVMAVSNIQHIPAVLAVEAMIISIGSSVGSTVAAAMWTGIFPKRLMEYLPAESLDNFTAIYGDITVQSGYPVGSPTRHAIERAYGDTQRLMLIAATCVYSVTLVSTIMWKNVDVKNMKQRTLGLV